MHHLLIFLLDHLLYYCIQHHFRQMENNKINKTGNNETVQPKKEDANCNVLAAISSFWVCSITTIFISKHLLDVCFYFQFIFLKTSSKIYFPKSAFLKTRSIGLNSQNSSECFFIISATCKVVKYSFLL